MFDFHFFLRRQKLQSSHFFSLPPSLHLSFTVLFVSSVNFYLVILTHPTHSHSLCLLFASFHPSPILSFSCSLHPRAYRALESLWSHLEEKISQLERAEDRETQRRRKQWRGRRQRKPNPIVVWNREYPPIYCLASDLCGEKSVVIYSQQAFKSIHVLWWSGADSPPFSVCVCAHVIVWDVFCN